MSGMFQSPDTIASVAAETVPQGDVAISVSVDQVHGVAGLIQPGDKVDILIDVNGSQETYLYQAVPVLAVGTTLVPAPGTTESATQTTTPAGLQRHHLRRPARRRGPHRPGQQRRWRSDRGHLPRPRGHGQQPTAPTTINGSNLIPATPTAQGSTSAGTSLALPASPSGSTGSTGSSSQSSSAGSSAPGSYDPTP